MSQTAASGGGIAGCNIVSALCLLLTESLSVSSRQKLMSRTILLFLPMYEAAVLLIHSVLVTINTAMSLYQIILLFHCRDLKVIILGPASVGKTCFMQRYMTGEFNDKYVPVSTSSVYMTQHQLYSLMPRPLSRLNFIL